VTRSTSAETYRQIEADGTLSAVRWAAYTCLFKHGPLTGAELDDTLKDSGGRGHYHKRLPELRDRGVVAEVGKRCCRITGHEAIEWDVTDSLPSELPKKAPKPNKVELGKALAELRTLLRDSKSTPSPELTKLGRWLVGMVRD
jgi:hypothetical protein